MIEQAVLPANAPCEAQPTASVAGLGLRRGPCALVIVLGASIVLLESWLQHGRGWCIGLLLMAVLPSTLRSGGPRFHPLDPETFVPFMYFLCMGYSPLVQWLSGDGEGLSRLRTDVARLGYEGAVACALVSVAMSRPATRVGDFPHATDAERITDLAIALEALVAVAAIGAWFVRVGVSAVFSSSYVGTYVQEQGFGFLLGGWETIQLDACYAGVRVMQLRSANRPVPKFLYLLAGGLAALMLVQSVLGRRGPLVFQLLALVLAAHGSGARIRRWWIVVAACGALLYSTFMEGARTRQGSSVDSEVQAGWTQIQRVRSPLEISEFESISGNLELLLVERPALVAYPGESWVLALGQQVPVVVWPDRPKTIAEKLVLAISPRIAHAGGGLASGEVSEGWLNFGDAGVVIEVGIFTALFAFWPLRTAMRRGGSALVVAFASTLGAYSYFHYRSELAGILKLVIAMGASAAAAGLLAVIVRRLSRPDPAAMRPHAEGSA